MPRLPKGPWARGAAWTTRAPWQLLAGPGIQCQQGHRLRDQSPGAHACQTSKASASAQQAQVPTATPGSVSTPGKPRCQDPARLARLIQQHRGWGARCSADHVTAAAAGSGRRCCAHGHAAGQRRARCPGVVLGIVQLTGAHAAPRRVMATCGVHGGEGLLGCCTLAGRCAVPYPPVLRRWQHSAAGDPAGPTGICTARRHARPRHAASWPPAARLRHAVGWHTAHAYKLTRLARTLSLPKLSSQGLVSWPCQHAIFFGSQDQAAHVPMVVEQQRQLPCQQSRAWCGRLAASTLLRR
jgi:hypothetical protein